MKAIGGVLSTGRVRLSRAETRRPTGKPNDHQSYAEWGAAVTWADEMKTVPASGGGWVEKGKIRVAIAAPAEL